MTPPTSRYSQRRREVLRKLGIERLPTLQMSDSSDQTIAGSFDDLPVRTMPVSLNTLRLMKYKLTTCRYLVGNAHNALRRVTLFG